MPYPLYHEIVISDVELYSKQSLKAEAEGIQVLHYHPGLGPTPQGYLIQGSQSVPAA